MKTFRAFAVAGVLYLTGWPLCAATGLYPHPPLPRFETGDEGLGCFELEQRIMALTPLTYSDKPGFYDDPYHGVSLWGGALWTSGLWSYLAYSGAAEYTEYSRTRQALERIAALRLLKARQRCHER